MDSQVVEITRRTPLSSCPGSGNGNDAGKKAFRTKEEAIAFDAKNAAQYKDTHAPTLPYKCEFCPDWHLTSKPRDPGAAAKPAISLSEAALRNPIEVRRQRIKELYAKSEMTYQEIADKLGCPFHTVCSDIAKMQEEGTIPRRSAERKSKPTVAPQTINDLDAQIAALLAQKKRLEEQMAFRIQPCYEGRGVYVQRGFVLDGKMQQVMFGLPLEDARELVRKLGEFLATG